MRGVVGILGRPWDEERILRGDGLADEDCAGGAEPVHDDRVPFGPASSEKISAEFGRHVGGADDVVDGEGETMERSWRTARRPRVVDALRPCESEARSGRGEGQ